MKMLRLAVVASVLALCATFGSIQPALAGSDETCLVRDCSAG